MNKFRLINIFVRTEDELPSERSEHYPPNGVNTTLRAECILHPERDSTSAPSEVGQYTLCSADDVKSEFSFCKNKQHLYRRLLILLDCSGL